MRLFGKNSVKIVSSSIGYIPDVYEHEVKNMAWISTPKSHTCLGGISNALSNLTFSSSPTGGHHSSHSVSNAPSGQQTVKPTFHKSVTNPALRTMVIIFVKKIDKLITLFQNYIVLFLKTNLNISKPLPF